MSELIECTDCGRRTFYHKRRCLDCGGKKFEQVPMVPGELIAVTTVHVTPDGVREPNMLGLASFPGGANIIAQLDGDIEVGESVEFITDCELRATNDRTTYGGRLVAVE